MKTTKKQLEREVRKINEEYERDGSDFRAYLTGDPDNPIGLRELKEADFPPRLYEEPPDLKLYKVVKPI